MTASSLCVCEAVAPADGARATLARLAARGVEMWCDKGELCLRAPRGALTPDDLALLAREKPALLRELADDAAYHGAHLLRPTPEQDLMLRAGGGVGYVVAGLFSLDPPATPTAVAEALAQVLRRHDAFRMRATLAADGSFRIDLATSPPMPRTVALDGLDRAAQDAVLSALAQIEARRTFEPTRDALARLTIVCADRRAVALALSAHHVIMDRWSMDVLGAELTEALATAERGAPWRPGAAPSFAAMMTTRVRALESSEVMAATREARAAMRAPVDSLDRARFHQPCAPSLPLPRGHRQSCLPRLRSFCGAAATAIDCVSGFRSRVGQTYVRKRRSGFSRRQSRFSSACARTSGPTRSSPMRRAQSTRASLCRTPIYALQALARPRVPCRRST